jgi:hypothetical protein
LPYQQQVFFDDSTDLQELVEQGLLNSKLTMWFEKNKDANDEAARTILYPLFPHYFTWRAGAWHRRVAGESDTIGRMHTVSPVDRERYHLRVLLNHVAGAQSFEDLRTVNGRLCDTFTEAALLRGLIGDDAEWDACMTEASQFRMPRQLRVLFVAILTHCQPANPQQLFDNRTTTQT